MNDWKLEILTLKQEMIMVTVWYFLANLLGFDSC